jgi:hypothetical protein
MTFLEQVYAKRKKLADVLSDDDYSGIRDIVEQLYPDRAHFIYELLQNAEDTGATTANFQLRRNGLTFEHDGRPFDEQDVWRITNIGKSTKKEDQDKIGRFGIGFKAVFAYSETPHVWSPTYSFKISDLVLPHALDPRPDLGSKTRFEFPFNNPKKTVESAYGEIRDGLNELAETTLLFLSHLESISWQADQGISGIVRRIQHSQYHFEVLKQLDGKTTTSFHFLKFDKPARGLEKQRVAIAFVLDFLPDARNYDHRKPLAKQVKIIPVPGKVAVYFPAEKEASGLRFHLHAPFVPELSRASIKETPANLPLFEELAELTASSLHIIRDLGLLSGDFLTVLPNPQDAVPARYKVIRTVIVDQMNIEPLTPTYAKSHAPAKHLLQGRAALKDLVTKADLEFLMGIQDGPVQWAIGATQRNSDIDRFLAGLAITDWDTDKFVEVLEDKSSEGTRYIAEPPHYAEGPDRKFMDWLSRKPSTWHQDLYALLFEHISNLGWRKSQALEKLKVLRIIRRSDGTYGTARNSYFQSDGVDHDDLLPRVDRAVYTSGKSKLQQQNSKKFLEEVNVRAVGEAEQVEAILDRRYEREGFKPLKQDLKRFMALVETDSTKAALFSNYFIFELKDGKWGNPTQVFLDEPFKDTGLTFYYDAIENPARFPLSDRYQDGQIPISRLLKFAEAVGVQTQLEVEIVPCSSNPEWPYLRSVGGDRQRSPIDRDYIISGLDRLLAKPSLEIARLLWRTMASLSQKTPHLQATFRKNESCGSHYADSQLVHHLRESAWVPQGKGLFVRPREASRDLLPEGFAFDPGWVWLKAIQFGASVLKKSEQQLQTEDLAKELGFADSGTLERAKRFAALAPEEQERILAAEERKATTELPEHEPANPERRTQRVGAKAASAPDRRSEERTRSVSIGLDQVKQEAAQYLSQQYTNANSEMICQICKIQLPFRLDDGKDYFEAVEFLPELTKRHYQNYLALCPNHAAMFQYANSSSDSSENDFVNLAVNELAVVLAQKDLTIYFTKTHTIDLKEVIRVDRAEANADQSVGDDDPPAASGSAAT